MDIIQALARDGFRCVVTGYYDGHSVHANQELRRLVEADLETRATTTDCAQIFAESTNWLNKILPLYCFNYIHRLENMMTVIRDFRILFDELRIRFVATNKTNKYRLEATEPIDLRPYPEYVTLTTPDPVNLPVPRPEYLTVHAVCAKIAHLSGATEYMDKIDQELEDAMTLDLNGASVAMLDHALSRIQTKPQPWEE